LTDHVVEHFQGVINQSIEKWYSLPENRVYHTSSRLAKNYRSGIRKVEVWLPLFLKVPIFLPKFRHKQPEIDYLQRLFGMMDSFLVALIYALYVSGISYRKISEILKLLRLNISPTTVSNKLRKLERFMNEYWSRDLSGKDYRYLMVDGMWVKDRGSISGRKVVLSAVGVTESGEREVLGYTIQNSESEESWRALFESLIERGIDMKKISLIVGDGSSGLRKYLKNIPVKIPLQVCGFHYGVNVLKDVKNKITKQLMFSDYFWIVRSKDLEGLNSREVIKKIKLKVEVVSEQWELAGRRNSLKLKRDFDKVITVFRVIEDPSKARKLFTNNVVERYFRDYKQFLYEKASFNDEKSINYLTGLVFYDINQRLRRKPPLWHK